MNSLYDQVKKYDFDELFKSFDANEIFPSVNDRSFWGELSLAAQKSILSKAERDRKYEYLKLSAGKILEFSQSGNRRGYEDPYFENRKILCNFVLAECIENKGKYLKKIIDGIWSICEESSWALPAHYFISKQSDIFPDVSDTPIIDLYSCETGNLLSVIYTVLIPVLDKVSAVIGRRIKYEVNRRVIRPYLENNDVFWMGFAENNAVNNWNPWCNCNCVICALLVAENKEDRKNAVIKALKSVDVFYKGYGEDGGCDEGPGYWDRAAASLFEMLDVLYKATDGKIYFGDDKKLSNMGDYINKVAITIDRFVNFADSRANTRVRGDLVFRFGKYVNNKNLMSFGAEHYKNEVSKNDIAGEIGITLSREIMYLKVMSEMDNYKELPSLKKSVYMSDIQVMIARQSSEYNKGLVLAAKFGNNGEAHNHNDVGSFIIYKNAMPVCIDMGVGVYTAQTFSDKRYEILCMQSNYHNTPIISGKGQFDGKECAAYNCTFDDSCGDVTFCANIEKAYKLKSNWRRSFSMKDDTILITDEFDGCDIKGEIVFMMCQRPDVINQSVFVNDAEIRCFSRAQGIMVEAIDNSDPLLKDCWGDKLYRVIFTFDNFPKNTPVTFSIK